MSKFWLFRISVKVMYKNMWLGRPRFAVKALVGMGLLLALNAYLEMRKFGELAGLYFVGLTLITWFVFLPMLMYWIELKDNPSRIERIISTIPEYYD